MYIPTRYWQYIEQVAAAGNVDPVALLETAAWQVVERAADVFAAQDEGCVHVDIDPALADMLAENGPLLALFAHAVWPRAARTLGAEQLTASPMGEGDGRFQAIKARPTTAIEEQGPWRP
jgi:hypothetical protein